MKTLFWVPIFVLFVFPSVQGQNDSTEIKKMYHIWIIPIEKGRVKQGILFEVKDSSLIISNSWVKENYYKGNFNISEVNAKKIKKLKIRKTGALGTGLLIGGVSGAIVGIIIGALQHTGGGNKYDRSAQDGASIMLPILFTGIGLSIGGTIGGIKMNIPVKGSYTQFDRYTDKLNDYSLIQNSVGKILRSRSFSKIRDTVVDVDGNVYHTLALGGQVWMAKDLKVTHYRDGSKVPEVTNDAPQNIRKYNWSAISDSRKLCPSGWHVPANAEWTSLFNSLGGVYGAGGKLKEDFSIIGNISQWWSSSEQDADHAQSFYLNSETLTVIFTAAEKNNVLSVRCMRDY